MSTNKMAKKEKTEFMVKIAEQINRNVTVSSSDELEEMPGKQPVNGDHPAEDMEEDENGASKVVEEEGDDHDDAPDEMQGDEEKKEIQRLDDDLDDIGDLNGDGIAERIGTGHSMLSVDDDDGKEQEAPRAHLGSPHLDEEYKYDELNGDEIEVRKRAKSSSSVGSSKSSKEGGNKQRDRTRQRKKDRKKRRKNKVDWDQYPVFRPHDINGMNYELSDHHSFFLRMFWLNIKDI